MKWSILHRLFLYLGLSLVSGPSFSAELVIEKRPRHEGDLAHFAQRSVSVHNDFSVAMNLDSIRFEIERFETVAKPEPQLELFPFLDYLVVRVRNDGWAEFDGDRLELIASEGPPAPSPDERRPWEGDWEGDVDRVRRLLAGSDLVTDFGPVEDYRDFFFRLADDAEPFGFVMADRVPLETAEPPILSLKGRPRASPLATSGRVVLTVPEDLRERQPAVAAVRFPGALSSRRGIAASVPFCARRLGPTSLTEEGAFANDVLGAGIQGDLLQQWYIVFGNYEEKRVWAPRIGIRFGVTVDLGDGTDREVTYPVDRDLAPDEELSFELLFLTEKPAVFQVKVTPRFRFGRRRPVDFEPLTESGRTEFPRPFDLSWSSTQAFLRRLVSLDPEIVSRARAILDAGLDDRQYETTAEAAQAYRQFLQALILLSAGTLVEDADRCERAVERLVAHVVAPGDGQSSYRADLRKDLLAHAFPVICRVDPGRAARIAAERYLETGVRTDFISVVLCFAPARDRLLSYYRDQLLSSLEEGAESGSYRAPARFALAALTGAAGVRSVFEGEFPPDSTLYGCLGWAAGVAPSARERELLYGLVHSQLSDAELDANAAALLIDGLCATRASAFRSAVRAYAQRVAADWEHATGLFSALQYFEAIGVTQAELPLLTELGRYPYRSEVRNLARRLRGGGD